MSCVDESAVLDCSRGCRVQVDEETGEQEVRYCGSCCKLQVHDVLRGISPQRGADCFEVRFKNTRKEYFTNASGQHVQTGDVVVVEASAGHDVGIVTLEGTLALRQMACKGLAPQDGAPMRKIYRKARPFDIQKWQEAVARERETMIRARELASALGLDMKIGDVEFQGDGTKAIFYYVASERVDFRQLIKDMAAEFHIRVEMKQIGARQESGLIGGLGICGRELCCACHLTEFKSITTGVAREQDLSLTPAKLSGQCGKLKCCLNYEVEAYRDARSRIPRLEGGTLQFQDGTVYCVKTDILRETLYFSYEKGSFAEVYPLSAEKVREVQEMNRRGEMPETLRQERRGPALDFVSAVGDDAINRFDRRRRSGGRRGGKRRRGKETIPSPQASGDVSRGASAHAPAGSSPDTASMAGADDAH